MEQQQGQLEASGSVLSVLPTSFGAGCSGCSFVVRGSKIVRIHHQLVMMHQVVCLLLSAGSGFAAWRTSLSGCKQKLRASWDGSIGDVVYHYVPLRPASWVHITQLGGWRCLQGSSGGLRLLQSVGSCGGSFAQPVSVTTLPAFADGSWLCPCFQWGAC